MTKDEWAHVKGRLAGINTLAMVKPRHVLEAFIIGITVLGIVLAYQQWWHSGGISTQQIASVITCEVYPGGDITVCSGNSQAATATIYCYKGSQEIADLLHMQRCPGEDRWTPWMPIIILAVILIVGVLLAGISARRQDTAKSQPATSQYCRYCGKQIPTDSNFCPYCDRALGGKIIVRRPNGAE